MFDLCKCFFWRVVSAVMADPESARLGISGYTALREQSCDRDANDDFDAPAVGHTGAEAAEDVKMVVKHGEAADGDGEVLDEEFEPCLDPRLAVFESLAADKRPANAAGNAVVIPRHCDIDELPAGHRRDGRLQATHKY
jgi:hypothetical protein